MLQIYGDISEYVHPAAPSSLMYETQQIEEIDAIEGMQDGRYSPAYNGGNFSPVMDQPTHQFHKWVANSLI